MGATPQPRRPVDPERHSTLSTARENRAPARDWLCSCRNKQSKSSSFAVPVRAARFAPVTFWRHDMPADRLLSWAGLVFSMCFVASVVFAFV
jgi:hypothetical protein